MAYCLDTNVLLRIAQPAHPMHSIASDALKNLTVAGEELCVFPQNIREFWNVASRPADRNGLGLRPKQVELEVQRIESAFNVIADGPDIQQEWRRMVSFHGVSVVQVHDCYLAASVKIRGIHNLLTFNIADFSRYGITAIAPHQLV